MARYGRLAELEKRIDGFATSLSVWVYTDRARIHALEARVTKLEAIAGDYDEPVCEEDERYGDPD